MNDHEEVYLTAFDVTRLFKVSRSTLQRWITNDSQDFRTLCVRYVGRKLLFKKNALINWIDKQNE